MDSSQFLFFQPPRAAEGYFQLQSPIKNPLMWLRSKPAEGGPTAPSGSEPQMVRCPLTWKPLGRWCPSGWLGRWEAQAWKDALTTRPFSGCGGRKLFTMWILSSSSEVKSKLRNFSIFKTKRMVMAGVGAVFLYNPSCCSGNSALLLLGFTLSTLSYLFSTRSLNKELEG